MLSTPVIMASALVLDDMVMISVECLSRKDCGQAHGRRHPASIFLADLTPVTS